MRTVTFRRVRPVNGRGWVMRPRNSCRFRKTRSGRLAVKSPVRNSS